MPDRIEGAAAPVEVDVFEVDQYGTLRVYGAPTPGTWRELFGVCDGDFTTPEHMSTLADTIPPLAEMLQGIAERECALLEGSLDDWDDDVEDRDEEALDPEQRREAEARRLHHDQTLDLIAQVQGSDDGWLAWARTLPADRLAELEQTIDTWLKRPVDFGDLISRGIFLGPQGDALRFFQELGAADLDDLGVRLVYGDCPGSTYYAAELILAPGIASARAEAAGLPVRFLAANIRTLVPAKIPQFDRAAPPNAANTPALRTWFMPSFGLAPEVMGLVPGQAPGQTLGQAPGHAPGLGQDRVSERLTDADDLALELPESLRAVHEPALMASAWRRIKRWLREPFPVWVDAQGTRHVNVLGSSIYSIDTAGRLQVHLWERVGLTLGALQHLPQADISLHPLPYQELWWHRWGELFACEAVAWAQRRGRSWEEQRLADAWAGWVFDRLRNKVRRHCDLRAMRHRLGQALGLDPLALDVARRVCAARGVGASLNLSSFSRFERACSC